MVRHKTVVRRRSNAPGLVGQARAEAAPAVASRPKERRKRRLRPGMYVLALGKTSREPFNFDIFSEFFLHLYFLTRSPNPRTRGRGLEGNP